MSAGYGYGMFQRQQAQMHMSPKMQQAIRILQLSTPDLLEFVQQEIEHNPVLEARNLYGDVLRRKNQRGTSLDPLDFVAAPPATLEMRLMEQLNVMTVISGSMKRIVRYMIGNLDSNGYLELRLDEIAEGLQAQEAEAAKALGILQSLEPAGIGARNLAECLLLQARRSPNYSPLVGRLITGHLQEIADCRTDQLTKDLQASAADIQHAVNVIKGLNPRPGLFAQADTVQMIIPDVIVEQADGQWIVSIHDTSLPRLSISGHYERMAKEMGKTGEARKYLYAQLNAAAFLIRCIEQRRMTLVRVTRAIVEEQEAFFRNGVSHLKPMILAEIADKVNLHESTVSRATSGKYAQTPWGVFELADFFPSGFSRGTDSAASTESVKEKIKSLVKEEDKRKPLSDQVLADLLGGQGIPIARRTVMKYREELGILSSVRRKRLGP